MGSELASSHNFENDGFEAYLLCLTRFLGAPILTFLLCVKTRGCPYFLNVPPD